MKTTHSRFVLCAVAAGLLAFAGGEAAAIQGDSSQANRPQTATVQTGIPTDQGTDRVMSPGTAPSAMTLDTSNPPPIMNEEVPIIFTDVQPGYLGGQLMVPVREFAQQMGALVTWDHGTKQVMVEMPNEPILSLANNPGWFSSNSDSDQGRAERFSNSAPAAPGIVIINDHAYMPLDQLAAVMKGSANWDKTSGVATISFPESGSSVPMDRSVNPRDTPDSAIPGSEGP
jgi:hypothetical protein